MAAKSHRRYHEEDGRNTALSTTEPVVSTDSSMVVATHEPQGGGGCLAPFHRQRIPHGCTVILLPMSPHAYGRTVVTTWLGGIEESESSVPLRRRSLRLRPPLARLVRKRVGRKDPRRASAKPHPSGSPPSIAPSLHCHNVTVLEEPPPCAAFEFHVSCSPPAQFQHATKATTVRA